MDYTKATNDNLFLWKLAKVSGVPVHSSVYRDAVVAASAAGSTGTWPTVNDSADDIVNKLLPAAGMAGFQVTLEGFPKFPGGNNGSPHAYRGGPRRPGNWDRRPAALATSTWATVSSELERKLRNEPSRIPPQTGSCGLHPAHRTLLTAI